MHIRISNKNRFEVVNDITKLIDLPLLVKSKSQTTQVVGAIKMTQEKVEFELCNPYNIAAAKIVFIADNPKNIPVNTSVLIPADSVNLLKDISTPYSVILKEANVTAFNSSEKYKTKTLNNEFMSFNELKEQLRSKNPEPRATGTLNTINIHTLYEKLKFTESGVPTKNESFYDCSTAIALRFSNKRTILAATNKFVLTYTPVNDIFTTNDETAVFMLPLEFENTIGYLTRLTHTNTKISLFSNHIEIDATTVDDNEDTVEIHYILPLVNGTFPNPDEIIEKEISDYIVITDSELPTKLRKVARVNNSVRITYNNEIQKLIVSTIENMGDSDTNISVTVDCEPPTTPPNIAMSIARFKNIASTLLADGGNRITVKFSDKLIWFESPNYIFVSAPIVIPEDET